jgi:hypothetical protein
MWYIIFKKPRYLNDRGARMKGLTKNISKVAIASLIVMSGAVAAEAQVSTKVSKNSDRLTSAQTAKTQTAKILVVESSENQARHLKASPQNISSLLAQATSAESVRKNLRIEPLPITPPPPAEAPSNSPGLSFGTPSAFGAGWGDAFVGFSGSTGGKGRAGEVDGSISTGFGLGDPRSAVGLEITYNLGSIKRFAANGSFDAKLHRIVYSEGSSQVGVAVGMNTFAQYGNEAVTNSSIYGAVTTFSQLQPDNAINKMPISFTVGAGGGGFRLDPASLGVFAGVGVQIAPQLSVGAGWSGVGINSGLSYVPIPSIPLTVGLTVGDITDNSPGGRVLVLSIGYGFNFLPK